MSGLLPHSRTTGLAVSSEPTGQASWVRFGMLSSRSVWSAAASSASTSRAAICSLMRADFGFDGGGILALGLEHADLLGNGFARALELLFVGLGLAARLVAGEHVVDQVSSGRRPGAWRRSWTAAGFSRMTRISSMARRLSRAMGAGINANFQQLRDRGSRLVGIPPPMADRVGAPHSLLHSWISSWKPKSKPMIRFRNHNRAQRTGTKWNRRRSRR